MALSFALVTQVGGCAGECDDCPADVAAATSAAPGAPGVTAVGAGGVIGVAAAATVPAGLKRAVFNVEGMTCESCATGIMAALRGIDGVSNAGVEYATKEAWALVKKDIPETALVAAIEKHGYKATVKSIDPGAGG